MISKILYWIPRILTIFAILFMTMFSFDVFGGNESFGLKMLGFLIHNIPVFILIAILIIAWKWEFAGGVFLYSLQFTDLFFSLFYRKSWFHYCNCTISVYRDIVHPA